MVNLFVRLLSRQARTDSKCPVNQVELRVDEADTEAGDEPMELESSYREEVSAAEFSMVPDVSLSDDPEAMCSILCRICEKDTTNIPSHVVASHQMTAAQYRRLYPEDEYIRKVHHR
jgi:hypothetical protein